LIKFLTYSQGAEAGFLLDCLSQEGSSLGKKKKRIENLKVSQKGVFFGFGHFTVTSKLRVLFFVPEER